MLWLPYTLSEFSVSMSCPVSKLPVLWIMLALSEVLCQNFSCPILHTIECFAFGLSMHGLICLWSLAWCYLFDTLAIANAHCLQRVLAFYCTGNNKCVIIDASEITCHLAFCCTCSRRLAEWLNFIHNIIIYCHLEIKMKVVNSHRLWQLTEANYWSRLEISNITFSAPMLYIFKEFGCWNVNHIL